MVQATIVPQPTNTLNQQGVIPDQLVLPVILAAIAYWCWFKRGPLFLRWPTIVMLVLFTSGHPLGAIFEEELHPIAGPALILLIIGFGLVTTIGGFVGRSSWRRDSRYDTRGGWNDRY